MKVAAVACLVAAACRGAPSPEVFHDSSPHTVRFVTVPGGVRLEVLDWGGQGPPLVFLAGLENTAHVFDDFAPRFTDRFHVLGITRRGWGASSHPPAGSYAIPLLVADVRSALDSLHVTRADIVGHSIAGQELSWLAATDSNRIGRLVYLDAGFDYHAHPVLDSFPPQPPPTAAESASAPAALAYFRRMNGASLPEGDFRATESLSVAGRDLGPATPPTISAEVIHSAQALAPPLDHVRGPVLAVYDQPVSAQEFIPWLPPTDTAVPRIRHWALAWRAAQRDEFAAHVPQARIVEIPRASHYVFVVRPDTVAAAMRAFLLGTVGR